MTTVETNRRGHATRFAQDAAARGVEVVAVLRRRRHPERGGQRHRRVARRPSPCCPGGSTNVFARILGVPNDPVPAADLMADAIKRESTRRVGLGSVNRRYFCFHTGIGFDAAVVGRVERQATLKRWAGHPLFVWAGLTTWLRGYDRRHPHFGLTFPDGDGGARRLLHHRASTAIRTPTSATGPCRWRPPPTSTGDWWPSPSARCGPGPCSAPSAGPLRGTPVAPSRRIDVRTDLAGVEVVVGARRSPTRSTATSWATPAACRSATSPTSSTS